MVSLQVQSSILACCSSFSSSMLLAFAHMLSDSVEATVNV